MKNPLISYCIITVGVVAVAVGLYFMTQGRHPFRAELGIGIGAALIIAGVVALFVLKPRASQ